MGGVITRSGVYKVYIVHPCAQNVKVIHNPQNALTSTFIHSWTNRGCEDIDRGVYNVHLYTPERPQR